MNTHMKTFTQFSQQLAELKEQKINGISIGCDSRTGYMMGAVYYTHLYIRALQNTEIDPRGLDKSDKKALANIFCADQLQGSIYTDDEGVRWYIFREGSKLYAQTLTEWLTPSRKHSTLLPVDNFRIAHPLTNLDNCTVCPIGKVWPNIKAFWAR